MTFGYQPRTTPANPSPQHQIDLLLGASRQFDLPPLYALYTGPDFQIDPTNWSCGEIAFDPMTMGVSVLPAMVAAWLLNLGATGQEGVNSYSRPLPCQLCPAHCLGYHTPLRWLLSMTTFDPIDLGFDRGTPPDDPPFRVALSYLAMMATARVGQLRTLDVRRLPEVTYVTRGIRTDPPSYVRAALESSGPCHAEQFEEPAPPRVVVMRADDVFGDQ
jgi:hypothetical protein